jgi:hypothetical protein
MGGSVFPAAIAPPRRTRVAGFGPNVATVEHAIDVAIAAAARSESSAGYTLDLDRVAGRTRRAPTSARTSGREWLRLAGEPPRHAARDLARLHVRLTFDAVPAEARQ